MKTRWSGCGTALVTPFTKTGDVDEAAVTALVKRQIRGGVHFLVPCGTTGESPTLSVAEKLRIVELVVSEAGGRVPVLAGAGGYDTRAVAGLAKDMIACGADGILSVTPYYNKPSPEGLYAHFRTVADAVNGPVIVYNVPGRTGCNVDPPTLLRLATVDNIVGVKEASGNLGQICTVCREVPESFSVLSGDDAFTLAVMAMGGSGVISVASNEIPKEMASLVDAAKDGDFAKARSIHKHWLPLMQVNFIESNPIPVKAALAIMGVLEGATYRLPLVPPRAAARARIVDVIHELGLEGPKLREAVSG